MISGQVHRRYLARWLSMAGLSLVLSTVSVMGCRSDHWRLLTNDNQPPALPISAIAFASPRQGWAITPSEVLRTSDSGRSWESVVFGEEDTFHSIAFINPEQGWIVGGKFQDGTYCGLLMHTVDAGTTWRQEVRPKSGTFKSLDFFDDQIGWAMGSNEIVQTIDGGRTWRTRYVVPAGEKLMSIASAGPTSVCVVGENGLILRTKDGGESWARAESKTSNTLLRVRIAGGHGWILGTIGTLLVTNDSGLTWTKRDLKVVNALADIYIERNTGWIVGSDGIILHSTDGGLSWRQEQSPTANDLLTIFFRDGNCGWACGAKRTIIHLSECGVP